jgi:hypothetical protein
VHQREVDTLVFRLTADWIQKLVDRLAMRWPFADSYFVTEKMVMEELELMREKVDRYVPCTTPTPHVFIAGLSRGRFQTDGRTDGRSDDGRGGVHDLDAL